MTTPPASSPETAEGRLRSWANEREKRQLLLLGNEDICAECMGEPGECLDDCPRRAAREVLALLDAARAQSDRAEVNARIERSQLTAAIAVARLKGA